MISVQFLFLLALIFSFEIGTAVAIYTKRSQLNETLDNSFKQMLTNHTANVDLWSNVQSQVKLLTILYLKLWQNQRSNWTKHVWKIPNLKKCFSLCRWSVAVFIAQMIGLTNWIRQIYRRHVARIRQIHRVQRMTVRKRMHRSMAVSPF